MRKDYFNAEEGGIFKQEKPQAPPKNPMQGIVNLYVSFFFWLILKFLILFIVSIKFYL